MSPARFQINKFWIATWIIIYAAIITVGLFAPQNPLLTAIKVGGVLLCSIYTLCTFPKDHFLQAAMLTTFVADCILAYNNISTVGLFVFYLAQSTHLYRLQSKAHRAQTATIIAGAAFVIILNFFAKLLPPIFLICGFYATALICNIYLNWRWYQSNTKNLAAICGLTGFTLFACCDLCTVVSFMSLTSVFPAWLYAPANFLAWFFYYPSQILVSNSTKCATIDAKEGKC